MSTVKCGFCNGILPVDSVTCTPCSHVFHNHCVTQIVIRWRNCPQCKQSIEPQELVQMFFDESNDPSIEDIIKKCKEDIIIFKTHHEFHTKLWQQLRLENQAKKRLEDDYKTLCDKLKLFKKIKKIINNPPRDICDIILQYHKDPRVVMASTLFLKTKGETSLAEEKRKTQRLKKKLEQARAIQMEVRNKLNSYEEKIQVNETKIAELRHKLISHPPTKKPLKNVGPQLNEVKTKKITRKRALRT